MVYLDKMLSGWSAEERKKININWDRIMIGFSNLQDQIRFLAGGEEIDEILQRIEDAITNAKNATNDAITAIGEINSALARLDILITNTNASAQRAETAADDADQMNQILNSLKTELQALQTELNGIVQAEVQRVANETVRVDAEQQRVAAENSRVTTENARETAEQGRIMAETNRKTAEQEREQAEQNRQQKLEELLAVLDHLDFKGEYNPARSYLPFNVVRFGRASYVALLEVSGIQPSDDGVNWRLLAAGGIDGSGAVSTVNGIEPDELGNVKLIIDYINNLTSERVDVGLSAAMGKFLKSLIDALALEKVDAAFVKTEVEALVNAAPGALDTLSELADALGNDPNFATTIIDMLATKASNDQLATTNDNLAQTNNNLTALDTKVTTHLEETKKWIGASTTQAQTILSGVETDLKWDTFYNVNDADFATIVDNKLVLKKGTYIFWAQTEFIANVNGQRRFGVAGFNNNRIGDGTYDTSISVNYIINVTENNYFLPCKVYQDSGEALNLKSGYSVIRILKVGDVG